MEFFENRPVLSLRQMSMTKLATLVCRDPKILNFMKINGCASYVFPSKNTHLYLGVKNPRKDVWMWKSLVRDVNLTPYDERSRRDAPDELNWQIKRNILPFARWEELVNKRISSLPKLLQQELLDVIRLVSIEIDKWIKYHSLIWARSSHIARHFQYEFQWNSLGKIDQERTAMKLILNKRLPTRDRCTLCVLYDLTDMIPLQEKVPDEIIQTYRRRELPISMAFAGIKINYLKRKDMFATAGCKQKMLFLGDALLRECLQYEDFLFYLSHLKDYEREAIFKYYGFKILRMYFLEWPLQSKFLSAAEQLLPHLNEEDFCDLLKIIVYERIMLGWEDFNYIDLLKEFWSLSPLHLKEYIMALGPFYVAIMFIINFPVGGNFPNEILFKSHQRDALVFQYSGVKYCLYKKNEVVSKKKSFLSNILSPPQLQEFHTITSTMSRII
ncbi:uncharacterized protein TNIN_315361 [Trichonephila inaurata madagascariensis]|uniref:Uncharacterized protein n=1 Tax=Trichonephila inaurata madagascariensis TaxID=2747483 RepID=A0A8X7BP86_9ARAC|nr:uncharacterized protein TNIN_315361 [Trichonephila inaurata madagascariensis]